MSERPAKGKYAEKAPAPKKPAEGNAGAGAAFRYVFRYFMRREKAYLLILLLDTVVAGAQPLIHVVFPALIVQELIGARDAASAARLICAMALLQFASRAALACTQSHLSRRGSMINSAYMGLIADRCMSLPFRDIEDIRVIERTRAAKDGFDRTGGIARLAVQVGSLGRSAFTLAGTAIVIARLDIWLILIVAASIAAKTLIGSKQKKNELAFWQNMVGYNTRFFYVVSIILNRRFAKDIRLFDAKGVFIGQMEKFIEYIRREFKIKSGRQAKCNIGAYAADSLQNICVYGYLAAKAVARAISIADFTMQFSAVQSFADSTMQAMADILDVWQGCNFLSPGVSFLGEEMPGQPQGLTCRAQRPAIAIENVSHRYPGQERFSLRNVSLDIPYGHKLCIVGMNGAGKTTLVKLLLRLCEPLEGKILLDGADINAFEPQSYLKCYSAVFQDYRLLPASISENILLGKEEDPQGVGTALRQAGLFERVRAMRAGADTQLTRQFDPQGVDLSGGEAQKLAIARALYKDAPVLILDEPTASLDPRMEHEIYARLHEIVRGKTAIYISHRMASCMFSDSIAVFNGGELVDRGAHDALMKRCALYREMFQAQADFYLQPANIAGMA